MTTWTATMAVETRIRHRGEVHTVNAMEGSLVTFRSPRARACVADARHCGFALKLTGEGGPCRWLPRTLGW